MTNFLKSMELELVPIVSLSSKSGKTEHVKKKGVSRELQNLQFGINYDKPEKAKGIYKDK